MTRCMLLFIAVLMLAACGTKSDLVTPSGKPTPANEQDPSKPNHQLGQ